MALEASQASARELQASRVAKELERVTDELIRDLFAQARQPDPRREERIRVLEQQRDELHDRLDVLAA